MKVRLFSAALVPLTIAAIIGTAPAANAITTDASIHLGSSIAMSATSLKICATITFTSGFVPNSTLSLDISGAEYLGSIDVVPIVATPTQTDFAPSQTICHQQPLSAGTTVHVDYTVEGAGLAPTPFLGSCAGTVSRINGGSSLTYKSC